MTLTEVSAFRTAQANLIGAGQSLAHEVGRSGITDPTSPHYHPVVAAAAKTFAETEAAYLAAFQPIWDRTIDHTARSAGAQQ